jgi:adenylosuccinate lyase
MGRQEAHEIVRRCSMECQMKAGDFKRILMESKDVAKLITEEELDSALDPRAYLGNAGQTVDRVLAIVS